MTVHVSTFVVGLLCNYYYYVRRCLRPWNVGTMRGVGHTFKGGTRLRVTRTASAPPRPTLERSFKRLKRLRVKDVQQLKDGMDKRVAKEIARGGIYFHSLSLCLGFQHQPTVETPKRRVSILIRSLSKLRRIFNS